MFRTLQDYAKASHLPAPSAARYRQLSLISGTGCGDPFSQEEPLDVEAAYDMAPGAQQLVVGGDSCDNGDFGDQGLFNADTAILDGSGGAPLASVASNSWGSGFEDQPASLASIEHAFLVRAAAEGVGMYFSTGDISGPQAPATDPFAIAVGGTTLGIGKTGGRLFETGWSTIESLRDGQHWLHQFENGTAGGGPSLLWPQPAYQQGVVPASLSTVGGGRGSGPVRSAPDLSADADSATGFATGVLTFPRHGRPVFSEEDLGGTSLATPLVAGLVIATCCCSAQTTRTRWYSGTPGRSPCRATTT
jgi:subtilase family serine protease